MPTMVAISTVDQHGQEDAPSLSLRLRIAETCQRIVRLPLHVSDTGEYAAVAAHDIVEGMDVASAAIWELDRAASTWKLIGSAGEIDDQPLRTLLTLVPADAGAQTDAQRVNYMIDGVDCLSRAAASSAHQSGDYSSSSAILLKNTSKILRVLITWSHQMDDDQLHRAMETVAHHMGEGFDVLLANRDRVVHARLFRTLINGVPSAIVGVTEKGKCTHWNPAAEELFGWGESAVVGRPLRIVDRRELESFWSSIQSIRNCLIPVGIERECQRFDGSRFTARIVLMTVPRMEGETDYLLAINDVSSATMLKRLGQCELEVATQLSKSQTFGAHAPEILQTICQRLQWRAGEVWTLGEGGERWKCTSVWQSPQLPPDLAASITVGRTIRSDVGLPAEARRTRLIVCSDSNDNLHDIAIPIESDREVNAVLVFLGTRIDGHATELKKCLQSLALQIGQALSRERIVCSLRQAEQEQQQARKMEAVGMLAGGIAHDFNNLIAVVLGNCEMLQAQPLGDPQSREMIDEIRIVSERAAALTKKLLGFSRKRAVQAEVFQPSAILAECRGMLERLAGSTVTIETNLEQDVHQIRIDRIEFEQIVLNLVANARDAMLSGGTIAISLTNLRLELKDVLHYEDVRPGDFVALTVKDNGCGMDAAIQARVFEPFFTTKGAEKGTGLGLATVYGIVRRCRGIVQLKSVVGQGTEFTILLPRAEVGIKARSIHSPVLADPRGTETVLVVEDEDSLRRLVQRVLEVHGYSVVAVDRGATALEVLHSGKRVDLLLTDILMPGMNGRALANEARKLAPSMAVLYMSGFHECDELSGASEETPVLSKPFSSDVLVRAVRSGLDGRTS